MGSDLRWRLLSHTLTTNDSCYGFAYLFHECTVWKRVVWSSRLISFVLSPFFPSFMFHPSIPWMPRAGEGRCLTAAINHARKPPSYNRGATSTNKAEPTSSGRRDGEKRGQSEPSPRFPQTDLLPPAACPTMHLHIASRAGKKIALPLAVESVDSRRKKNKSPRMKSE